MKEKIREMVLAQGADACGFANAEDFSGCPAGFHPRDVFAGCRSVVVFAKRLPKGLARVSPRIVYTRMTDVGQLELDRIALVASVAIEDLGLTAVPLPCDTPYDYWETETAVGRGIISIKHAAELAGLGRQGKNTLLMHERFGNMINLGAILTDADLPSDPPAKSICIPSCRVCLDRCPTRALDGESANQTRCRPHTYVKHARGFTLCDCHLCRVSCPMAFGPPPGRER